MLLCMWVTNAKTCTYCGFSLDNKIKRKTLMDFEIKLEVAALKEAVLIMFY
jgi:2-iminoacetate synthase ThiH